MKELKNNNLIMEISLVLLILGTALGLRLYAAGKLPLEGDMKSGADGDERIQYEFAQTISFDPETLHLPLAGNAYMNHPVLTAYLIKISSMLFGSSLLGSRALFSILFSLSLLFVYATAKRHYGRTAAVISLLLLAFSQYHIHISLFMIEKIYLAFVPPAVYFFLRGTEKESPLSLIATGVFLGIGFWAKETMFLLLPGMFLYVLTTRKARKVWKKKVSYLSLLTVALIVAPAVYSLVTVSRDFSRHIHTAQGFGVSLRAFILYLYEPFHFLFNFIDPEFIKDIDFPASIAGMHWSLGILCLVGVYGACRNLFRDDGAGRYFLVTFFSVFLVVSFIRPKDVWDKYWWASISIFPAVMLTADMLSHWMRRRKILSALPALVAVMLFANALVLVNHEEICFFKEPRRRADYMLRRGLYYSRIGKYDLAVKRCKEVLEVFPDDSCAYNTLGISYSKMGEIDKAIEAHLKALELNPRNKLIHFNLGTDYFKNNEPEKAIKHYRRYLPFTSGNPDVFFLLGMAYLRMEDFEEAAKAFRAALAIDPGHQEAEEKLEEANERLNSTDNKE